MTLDEVIVWTEIVHPASQMGQVGHGWCRVRLRAVNGRWYPQHCVGTLTFPETPTPPDEQLIRQKRAHLLRSMQDFISAWVGRRETLPRPSKWDARTNTLTRCPPITIRVTAVELVLHNHYPENFKEQVEAIP